MRDRFVAFFSDEVELERDGDGGDGGAREEYSAHAAHKTQLSAYWSIEYTKNRGEIRGWEFGEHKRLNVPGYFQPHPPNVFP